VIIGREKVAFAMHCNLRLYDAAPVLGFNDEANSALAYIGQCTPKRVSFRFKMCCFVSKSERVKGDWSSKSR